MFNDIGDNVSNNDKSYANRLWSTLENVTRMFPYWARYYAVQYSVVVACSNASQIYTLGAAL